MTLTKQNIEFRQECEAPTEPGWYWAVMKRAVGGNIEPTFVSVWKSETMKVSLPGDERGWLLNAFRWFGPVTQVREG